MWNIHHCKFVFSRFIPPPAAEPVLLAQTSHHPPPALADAETVNEARHGNLVELGETSESLPDLPDPQPAVPGAGQQQVGVAVGGQGGHPVRVLIGRVHPVTVMHLELQIRTNMDREVDMNDMLSYL